jgi:predicted  nucleic acid-binding Zn-ribbon protein
MAEKHYTIEELEGFFKVAMEALSVSFKNELDNKFTWFQQFMEEKVKAIGENQDGKLSLMEARHASELKEINSKLDDLESRGREAIGGHIEENQSDIKSLKDSLGRAFKRIEKVEGDIEDIKEAPVLKKAELVDEINSKIKTGLITFLAGGLGMGIGYFILEAIRKGVG